MGGRKEIGCSCSTTCGKQVRCMTPFYPAKRKMTGYPRPCLRIPPLASRNWDHLISVKEEPHRADFIGGRGGSERTALLIHSANALFGRRSPAGGRLRLTSGPGTCQRPSARWQRPPGANTNRHRVRANEPTKSADGSEAKGCWLSRM